MLYTCNAAHYMLFEDKDTHIMLHNMLFEDKDKLIYLNKLT